MNVQLQSDYLTRFDARTFKRTKRRIRSSLLTWYRKQYFLTTACSEFATAVRRNEDIYLASVSLGYILAYGFTLIATQIIFLFFETAFALSELTNMSMLPLSIAAVSVLAVCLAWMAALVSNSQALALMQGLNKKQRRTILRTFRLALRQSSRTVSSWLITLTVITGPIFVAFFLSAIASHKLGVDKNTLLSVAPYAAGLGVLWVAYSLAQYSLIPYVALFEPSTTTAEWFSRSKQLVQRRGKMFILAAHLALGTIIGLLVGLSLLIERTVHINKVITLTIGLIAVFTLANGVMTLFYRKRRLARS